MEIDTTAVKAKTQFLTLRFVAEADPRPQSAADDNDAPRPRCDNGLTQPKAEGQMVDPIARPRPTIKGDAISALLRRNEGGVSVKDLSVSGSVEVLHQLQTGGQSLQAELTGEEMRLRMPAAKMSCSSGADPNRQHVFNSVTVSLSVLRFKFVQRTTSCGSRTQVSFRCPLRRFQRG